MAVAQGRNKPVSQGLARDLLVEGGAKVIQSLERVVGLGSRIGNTEFYDASLFPWARRLEANWQKIRAELEQVLAKPDDIPAFQQISKDQTKLTNDRDWKTYFFYAFGFKAEANCAACPETTRLIEAVPGLQTAFFSILAPGKHIPPHRGAFKGLLRYHLGLIVPEPNEAVRIRVGSKVGYWHEGESLVFDDTYQHEVWNDTPETRVVLFLDVTRPLRFPVNLLNAAVIWLIKRSPFVKDGISNYEAWQAKLDRP